MRSSLLCALAVLGLLAACDRSAPKPDQSPAAGAPADPVARMKALPEARQLALAAAIVFPDERSHQVTVGDQNFTLTPERLVWSGDQPILVSGGQGDDCHGCAGTLAVHYLSVAGDGFLLGKAFPGAATGTSFGAPPSWKRREDIASAPVIQTERGGTFQGYTCARAQLVALTPAGPQTLADDLPTGYSDEGAVTEGKLQQISGTIEAGTKDRDFTIAYSGSMTGRTAYRRDGTGYKIDGKAADIPEC